MNHRLLVPTSLLFSLGVALAGGACSNSDSSVGDGDSSAGDGDGDQGEGGAAGDGDGDGDGDNNPGSGGNSPETGGTVEDFEDFCEAAQTYACDWFAQCRGVDCEESSGGPPQLIADTCSDDFKERVEDGTIFVDPALVDCVPSEVDCGTHPLEPFTRGECRALINTGAELGDDCSNTGTPLVASCAEGFCDLGDQCPGTCTAFVEAGEDCSAANCAPGLACENNECVTSPVAGESCGGAGCRSLVQCIDGTCVSPGGEGDDCGENEPCSQGLSCIDGTCKAESALGEACQGTNNCPDGTGCFPVEVDGPSLCREYFEPGDDCIGNECGPDAFCDTTCQEFGKNGDPCEPNGCAAGFWCWYPASGLPEDGECRPQGGLGDSCASEGEGDKSNDAPRCLDSPNRLFCVNDECVAAGEEGDDCDPRSRSSCTDGLWCSFTSGQCEAPSGEGEGCNHFFPEEEQCESGLFCDCPTDSCEGETTDEATCETKKALGALCDNFFECASENCEYEGDTGRCAEAPMTCDLFD